MEESTEPVECTPVPEASLSNEDTAVGKGLDDNMSELREELRGMDIKTKYGSKDYWDKRYVVSGEDMYDWHIDYDTLKGVISAVIKKDQRILMLGCGNSPFSVEMYDDGYENIVNIDISPVCIETMAAQNENRPTMTWEVMDCSALTYEDASFDVVIDKATADAVVCCPEGQDLVGKLFQESHRVLKPKGTFILVTGQEKVRAILDEKGLPWKVGSMQVKTAMVNKTKAAAQDHVNFVVARKKAPEMSSANKQKLLVAKLMMAKAQTEDENGVKSSMIEEFRKMKAAKEAKEKAAQAAQETQAGDANS